MRVFIALLCACVSGMIFSASVLAHSGKFESANTTIQASVAKQAELKDGDPALLDTALPQSDATAKVKAYFNSKNIDYTVNPETGRVTSDWFDERRCGPGFHRCANRATVRVTAEEGKTVIRVQVLERKREAGINNKPWNENSKSKAKETAKVAAELEAFLK